MQRLLGLLLCNFDIVLLKEFCQVHMKLQMIGLWIINKVSGQNQMAMRQLVRMMQNGTPMVTSISKNIYLSYLYVCVCVRTSV